MVYPFVKGDFWVWLFLLTALSITVARPWLVRAGELHGVSWNQVVVIADVGLPIALYRIADGRRPRARGD